MRFFFTIFREKKTDSREKKREFPNGSARRDMLPIYLFLVVILLAIAVVSVCQSSRILALGRELEALRDSFAGLSASYQSGSAGESEPSVIPRHWEK